MKVTIYTDGSARGNPDGPGGYGVVLQYIDPKGQLHETERSAGYVKTTNNRMELMAAIVGLEALTKPCEVTLYSDSQYLVKAFEDHWIDSWILKGWKNSQKQPVKNVDLWKRLLKAKEQHKVTFVCGTSAKRTLRQAGYRRCRWHGSAGRCDHRSRCLIRNNR